MRNNGSTPEFPKRPVTSNKENLKTQAGGQELLNQYDDPDYDEVEIFLS